MAVISHNKGNNIEDDDEEPTADKKPIDDEDEDSTKDPRESKKDDYTDEDKELGSHDSTEEAKKQNEDFYFEETTENAYIISFWPR